MNQESVQSGGCQCGAIRYQVDTKRSQLNICHCHDCQKQSGSAFGMSLVIPPDAFSLKQGEPALFITAADSGRQKTCAFCSQCGVRIYNRTSALMSVKAGTFDNTDWLQPDGQYFNDRMQPWLPSLQGIPNH